MTEFKEGEKVKLDSKYGIVFGTVKCYSIGWNPPLVWVDFDFENSTKGQLRDGWYAEASVQHLFEREVVQFT